MFFFFKIATVHGLDTNYQNPIFSKCFILTQLTSALDSQCDAMNADLSENLFGVFLSFTQNPLTHF